MLVYQSFWAWPHLTGIACSTCEAKPTSTSPWPWVVSMSGLKRRRQMELLKSRMELFEVQTNARRPLKCKLGGRKPSEGKIFSKSFKRSCTCVATLCLPQDMQAGRPESECIIFTFTENKYESKAARTSTVLDDPFASLPNDTKISAGRRKSTWKACLACERFTMLYKTPTEQIFRTFWKKIGTVGFGTCKEL